MVTGVDKAAVLAILILTLPGCSSWQQPADYDISELRDRAVTDNDNGIRLSAAVLSRDDNLRMFGADLNKEGIQSVWVEVENNTSHTLWLLRTGTDPDMFSPLEVSWAYHSTFATETNARLDDFFHSRAFQNPIPPESTRSGVLFTNPHEVLRLLNVDLLGQGKLYPFTLFPVIPDDSNRKDAQAFFKRLAATGGEDYKDASALRTRLRNLPCCSGDSRGVAAGQPLNFVAIGRIEDISAAMVRRGYRVKVKKNDIEQHLYGRPPDVVMRKSGQGTVPENWIRAWLAPFQYRGKPVFVAQVGRPVGGRFLQAEEQDPKLHPKVDEVRNMLIGDMMYSGGVGKLAFVTGSGRPSKDELGATYDEPGYYTDGIRAVMFFVTRPRAISEVKFLDWYPSIKLREEDATEKYHNRGE